MRQRKRCEQHGDSFAFCKTCQAYRCPTCSSFVDRRCSVCADRIAARVALRYGSATFVCSAPSCACAEQFANYEAYLHHLSDDTAPPALPAAPLHEHWWGTDSFKHIRHLRRPAPPALPNKTLTHKRVDLEVEQCGGGSSRFRVGQVGQDTIKRAKTHEKDRPHLVGKGGAEAGQE